jgi:hypothetical protein
MLIPVIVPVLSIIVWIYAALKIGNQVILPPIDNVLNLLVNPMENLISMGSLASNIAVSGTGADGIPAGSFHWHPPGRDHGLLRPGVLTDEYDSQCVSPDPPSGLGSSGHGNASSRIRRV